MGIFLSRFGWAGGRGGGGESEGFFLFFLYINLLFAYRGLGSFGVHVLLVSLCTGGGGFFFFFYSILNVMSGFGGRGGGGSL